MTVKLDPNEVVSLIIMQCQDVITKQFRHIPLTMAYCMAKQCWGFRDHLIKLICDGFDARI